MEKTAQHRQHIQSIRAQVFAERFNKKAIAVYVAMMFASNGAKANPTGGEFAQGMGAISNAAGLTTIQQTTQRAIVNWQSFGSNAGEVIKFVQPNANAAILNRVVGNLPSNLNGLLEGNGRVYLVNPNGIVLGANGVINVNGGFVASTQGISDGAFMQGGALLFTGENTGNIQVLGKISSAQGDIVIIAPKTEIAAGAELKAGQNIQLIATNEVQLSNGKFTVTPKLSDAGQLTVAGTLEAAKVQLEAHNNNLGALAINTTGIIRATGTQTNPDGSVSIMAYGEGSNIKVSGNISAYNNDASKQGGRIIVGRDEATGALAKSADVSGTTFTTNKGFLETSGNHLGFANTTVTANQWLLDPYDITIGTNEAQSISTSLTNNTSIFLTTATDVNNTGNNNATGNITITSAISKNGSNAAILDLKAVNNIVLNESITNTGGTVNLEATGGSITQAATKTINATNLNMKAGTTIGASNARINTSVDNLTLISAGSQYVTEATAVNAASRVTGDGSVNIETMVGALNIQGVKDATGTYVLGVETQGSGDINLVGRGSANVNEAGVWVANSGVRSAGGTINITGTANGSGGNSIGVRIANTNPLIGGANSGAINITGTSTNANGAAGIYMAGANDIQSKAKITIRGESVKGDGVTMQNGGKITSLAGGSNFNGNYSIDIQGTGVTVGSVITNNSTGVGTYIKAGINGAGGNLALLSTADITNNSTAGGIVIQAGETADSTNQIFAQSGATITQRAAADVMMVTEGNGNLTPAKILHDGASGAVRVGAGRSIGAGDGSGGQVRFAAGNTISNAHGYTYIYTGSVSGSASMSNFNNAAFATMNLDGTGQNVASNRGNGTQIEDSNNLAAKTQAIYREKIAVNLNNSLNGTTVNYGDVAKVANELTNTDAATKLKVANANRVLTWTTNGNNFSLHSDALLDTIQVGTAADISNAGKLKANAVAYTTTSSTYTLSGAPTLKVDQKSINISGITASDKVYDGNTTATVSTSNAVFNGMVSGDNLTVTNNSGSFADKSVGNGKTVTLANTLGGNDLGNYTFTDQATTTANITPKAVTVKANGNTVFYNGTQQTDTVTVTVTVSELLAKDKVDIVGAGSGTAEGVYQSNLRLEGDDAGNYIISPTNAPFTIKVNAPTNYANSTPSTAAVLLTPITFGFGVIGGATAAGGEVEGSCDAWSQRAGAGSISVVSLLKPTYMGLRTAKTDTMDAMAGSQATGSVADVSDNPCASAALVNKQAGL